MTRRTHLVESKKKKLKNCSAGTSCWNQIPLGFCWLLSVGGFGNGSDGFGGGLGVGFPASQAPNGNEETYGELRGLGREGGDEVFGD